MKTLSIFISLFIFQLTSMAQKPEPILSFAAYVKESAYYKQQAEIVDAMEKVVPHTYEYNLAKWMHHGQNFAYLKHLKKANELGSGRTEQVYLHPTK
ncbi:MAG: hypothetical protein Q8R57_12565 [Bacteroidota bacterium]|nr:hypothetical protein [Bacteroidota bacterium]